MSLTSNVSYPPSHSRMHPQPPYPHSYHPDISPTMSHESLPGNHGSSPVSPQIESSHLYSSSHYHQHHHHSHPHPHQHQQEYQHPPHQPPYHHAPYQAPSPPYSSSTSHPHRSSSAELVQKPTLPYPSSRHPQHTYSSPSHRAHPYSPPTLPPLSGRPPLSPQSPVDSSSHYPIPSSNADERQHHYRATSSSASPPPSSSQPTATSPLLSTTLSATDRRERNKAASAKYRAKKHYQSGEMRSQITTLQDQNNVLSRQLEECRSENASLKNLVEKLKGRLVAEKVLKRLREVGREKNKRRGSGSSSSSHSSSGNPSAGHLAAVSADDLATLSDSDTDDVVDAASVDLDDLDDVIDEEEEEEEEEEERKAKRTEKRPNDKKLNARRRARTNVDDKEYCDD